MNSTIIYYCKMCWQHKTYSPTAIGVVLCPICGKKMRAYMSFTEKEWPMYKAILEEQGLQFLDNLVKKELNQ